jgi:predicted  nucleic acid-binding Zn-ribbon protein
MTEPENLILKQLAAIRDDIASARAETRADIDHLNHKVGTIAQTLVAVQRDVSVLKDSVGTLAIAIDEHSRRLDRIEKRLGLDVEHH